MKLFKLVNKSGAEIEILVLADGQELFVRHMQAKTEESPGIVHPAQEEYPTLELKVPIDKHARKLSVEETIYLKKSQDFEISESPDREGAGFQIIISKDAIAVSQDYYAAR